VAKLPQKKSGNRLYDMVRSSGPVIFVCAVGRLGFARNGQVLPL